MTQRDNNDDVLDRAIAAMRSESIPPGPSDQILADTVQALRNASKPTGFWQRTMTMTLTQKIAAAVAMTIGGLTIYFILSLFSGLSSVSYAQVANVIRSMKTMSCDVSVTLPNVDKPTASKMLFMEPGKMRQEYAGGAVTISDSTARRALALVPQSKTAILLEISTTQPTTQAAGGNFIEGFKKLADASGEDVGEKQIGDINAKMFRVKQGGTSSMIFVNPKSGLPIRVEIELSDGQTKVVMDNFNFDANLDQSLFSLEPPPGYTLQTKKLSTSIDLAENLIPVLRAYAGKKDGRFPPRLDDWTEIFKTMLSGTTQPSEIQDQTMQVSAKAGAIMALLFSLEKGKTYDYLPDQVRLGEADKIVFWYQPRGAANYKAIYGDLHVAEISAKELPKR